MPWQKPLQIRSEIVAIIKVMGSQVYNVGWASIRQQAVATKLSNAVAILTQLKTISQRNMQLIVSFFYLNILDKYLVAFPKYFLKRSYFKYFYMYVSVLLLIFIFFIYIIKLLWTILIKNTASYCLLSNKFFERKLHTFCEIALNIKVLKKRLQF